MKLWLRGFLCLAVLESSHFVFLHAKCFYESCPKLDPSVINVHLVCHTHLDLGWLKTVDQYFWGANLSHARGGVQYITDTVISELQKDPKRRFTYVETGYFKRWYEMQHDYVRHMVKRLVSDGQLEFAEGAWGTNDEATTHYLGTLELLTTGLKYLNDTFGECGRPKVGWQIDPYGHSREQASLFSQVGYDAWFFSRIHYADRLKRIKDQTMEMVWRGSDDLGDSSDIFSGEFYTGSYFPPPYFCYDGACLDEPIMVNMHVNLDSGMSDILTGAFYVHYVPPIGFCFGPNVFCHDDPIMDDPRLEGYNVDERVSAFISYVKDQASHYKTNHVLLTMGGDFQYENAAHWFMNLDKLIQYVNERRDAKVNVFYSTPSCYVKALHDSQITWPTKSDDFYPYATGPHEYWVGCYTSRPTLKGFTRWVNSVLQACKQIEMFADLGPYDVSDLDILKQAFALVQNHGAIDGTSQQHVTDDWVKRMYRGVIECQRILDDAYPKILQKTANTSHKKQLLPKQELCPWLNETICNISQHTDQFAVSAWNGYSHAQNYFFRIPVSGQSKVFGPQRNGIFSEVLPVVSNNQLPTSKNASDYILVFNATLPPIGMSTFIIQSSSAPGLTTTDSIANTFIENKFFSLNFDESTGLLKSLTSKSSEETLQLSQDFLWYKPMLRSSPEERPSGAYIFRPNGSKPISVASEKISLKKVSGKLVQEMHQVFSSWASQIVRLYEDKPYAEFEWTIGPLPADYKTQVGTEVVSRFNTSISNGGTFYTDSNGRQIIKRMYKRNHQPTYEYNNTEPVAGNYYPVPTRIYIKDNQFQLTVLTDRSQAGSSIYDGSIELMVHRRLLQDDDFGVIEPLNETDFDGKGLVARGKHWVILSKTSNAILHRKLANELLHQPLQSFARVQSKDDYWKNFETNVVMLHKALPPNIQLITSEQWHASMILLRFEHFYQKGEDPVLSKPAVVELQNLFIRFEITSVEELTLGANRPLAELERLKWKTHRQSERNTLDQQQIAKETGFEITVNPMEIRTFRCSIKWL